MNYYFSVTEAKEKGLHQAILLSLYKDFEILLPKEDIVIISDRKWFCGGVIKMQKIMPFLTVKQITSLLRKMVNNGTLIKSRLNNDHFNRTYWYSLK